VTAPRPPADFLSPGGRFRIRWSVAESEAFFEPRLSAGDEVLLDLRGSGFTVSVRRAAGGVIDLYVVGLGDARGQGLLVVDADARTYLATAGAPAAVTALLDAAGLRCAGEPPVLVRPAGQDAEVTMDGRFALAWSWESEGHGATWRAPRVVDTRGGDVLLDLTGPESYGYTARVVRAAGAVIELWVARLFQGGECTVAIDADARTFALVPLVPPGARHRALRERLGLRGLADASG